MGVSFFGNSQLYHSRDKILSNLLDVLAEILGDNYECTFYCGCKGDSDWLWEQAIDTIKSSFPQIKNLYITPYLTISYQQNYLDMADDRFDDIIFPDVLTRCHAHYAYVLRNKWIVGNSDIILSYVVVSGGGY